MSFNIVGPGFEIATVEACQSIRVMRHFFWEQTWLLRIYGSPPASTSFARTEYSSQNWPTFVAARLLVILA